MTKITVLYPIEIPEGKYCWEYLPPYEICDYFSNEGGHPICGLGFSLVNDTDKGVLKAVECSNLQNMA